MLKLQSHELTCGERIVRCLLGEPIDRIPFGTGLGWGQWTEALEQWKIDSGNPQLDPAREFGFELSYAFPTIAYGIFPGFEHVVIEQTEEFIIARDGRGITTRNRRDYASMPEFLDYPVKTRADWEQLKRRLDPATPGRITEDWDAFRRRISQSGEAVQFGSFPWGVFGTARDLMGAEELLIAFCEEPQLVKDIMNRLTDLWVALLERVALHVQVDHVHIWEDMAGKQGSLISPAMVREFMMPCYDRIVAAAKKAGVRIISVDSDGQVNQLVPVMVEHGINAYFPFEVQAGNDVLDYRRDFPTLGILGGLDKRALGWKRADVDL
ncbi:MAG TPA: uroporphyrinogen decarboxylase family protein, partial [Tepidisphaeraceae bacterium]